MKSEDLLKLRSWFTDYVKSYYSPDEEVQFNIAFKERHTFNVCGNIVLVAEGESLGENDVLLARTAALFHDVGRFEQYTIYKTFSDGISVNHGALGASILAENNILRALSEEEREIIIGAVKYHNAFFLPKLENERLLMFIKLIRDADKLDIWKFMSEYMENPDERWSATIMLNLEETSGYSKEAISALFGGSVVPIKNLKTLDDLKLTHMSWVYDINFKTTFRLFEESKYLERYLRMLPNDEEIKKAFTLLKNYISRETGRHDFE